MATLTSTFPVLSGSNWWALRTKFKASYPKAAITEEYLASVLEMKIQSVKNNGILSNLRALGILDEENKCTDLANRWRLDDTYADACAEIREHVYPPELIDIGTDRNAVSTWFVHKSQASPSFANKLTALYLILAIPEIKEPTQKRKTVTKVQNKQERTIITRTEPTKDRDEHLNHAVELPKPAVPSMNINLQIHISAEASLEQIDQIFSSMAKHLYGRE